MPSLTQRITSESGPVRVLLVEDNPADARLVRELLRDADTTGRYQLVHVATLEEARSMLCARGFDLVLLDLCLPDAVGGEAVDVLRKDGVRVPVVVLTGLRDPEVSGRALRDGADVLVTKDCIDSSGLVRAMEYADVQHRVWYPSAPSNTADRQLGRLVAALPCGILVVSTDWRVLYSNPEAAHLLGRPGADLRGDTFEPMVRVGRRVPIELQRADGVVLRVEMHVTELEWNERPARLITMWP